MDFKKLLQTVRDLHIPQGTFVIFGSGPMAIRGPRNSMKNNRPKDMADIVKIKGYLAGI